MLAQGAAPGPPPPLESLPCRVCGKDIEADEEFIEATCNGCGRGPYHVDCVTPMLSKIHHDSTRAMERARRMIAVRPAYYMAEQKMRCPAGLAGEGGCGGRIVDAEMIKPVKAPIAPPPGLPPPPPKAKNKPASAGGAQNRPAQQNAAPAAPPPPPGPSKKQQQRAAAAALRRQVAPDYGSFSAAGSTGSAASYGGTAAGAAAGGGGGGPRGSKLNFPRGCRPVELQPCFKYDECGECFIHQCPRCHGEEELQERERQWVARQEAKKREDRQKELDRHEKAVAARSEQAAWLQQVAAREREVIEHEEAYLRMKDVSLTLMKQHKRKSCIANLCEMGFGHARAAAAADAAGCDVTLAAALLSEGSLLMDAKPVSVTGEAQELLAHAASLGLGLSEAEMALLLAEGDWLRAADELNQQAEAAVTAMSAAEAQAAARTAAAAGSTEDAELAAALAASASSSSGRGAGSAAGAGPSSVSAAELAREEAELAAAIAASRAEEEARRNRLLQPQQPAASYDHHHHQQQQQVAAAAGDADGWGAAAAALAAKQRAESAQQAQRYLIENPPPAPVSAPAPAPTAAAGSSSWYYGEEAKNGMPEYRGGWDVGPAAVVSAAAAGHSSSSLAAAIPIPATAAMAAVCPAHASSSSWQQQLQPVSDQLAASSSGLSLSLPAFANGADGYGSLNGSPLFGAQAALPAAASAQWNVAAGLAATAGAAAAAVHAPAPVSVSFSAAPASASNLSGGWGSLLQQAQPQLFNQQPPLAPATPGQQAADDSAEVEALMQQMMGL